MPQQLNKATGTQTAVIGTEHTLSTQTDSGIYVLVVNLKNMAAGDTLELRVLKKVLTGDAQHYLVFTASYANIQGDGADAGSSAKGEVVVKSLPIESPFSVKFTLKQPAGTGRNFDWRVDQIA